MPGRFCDGKGRASVERIHLIEEWSRQRREHELPSRKKSLTFMGEAIEPNRSSSKLHKYKIEYSQSQRRASGAGSLPTLQPDSHLRKAARWRARRVRRVPLAKRAPAAVRRRRTPARHVRRSRVTRGSVAEQSDPSTVGPATWARTHRRSDARGGGARRLLNDSQAALAEGADRFVRRRHLRRRHLFGSPASTVTRAYGTRATVAIAAD
jgi:hypothetical protein